MGLVDTSTWSTAIAQVRDDDVIVRGHRLSALVGEAGFAQVAFLVLTGAMPTDGQARVLEAMLVSVIEHGISPSSMVTRQLASYGVPVQAGIAGGQLTIGDFHGGAGEQIARRLHEIVEPLRQAGAVDDEALADAAAALVRDCRDAGRPVEGFGHPQHGADPRAGALLALAGEQGVSGVHCRLLELVERALERSLGRVVPANVDGAMAAILLDLGLPWRAARPLVMAPRVIGLAAHFIEEIEQGNKWRHVPNGQVAYTGALPPDPAGRP